MGDDAARVEAERRYPHKWHAHDGYVVDDVRIEPFVDGAAWQAAQPVVVSAEQRKEIAKAISRAHFDLIPDETARRQITTAGYAAADATLAALGITVDPPLFTARDTDGVEYEGGFTVEPTPTLREIAQQHGIQTGVTDADIDILTGRPTSEPTQ